MVGIPFTYHFFLDSEKHKVVTSCLRERKFNLKKVLMTKGCIFCKIVKGQIPSHKIYEDREHVAVLDIFPITKGQALVITKRHYGSYQFDLPDDVYTKLFLVSKKVGKSIDKSLKAQRTFLVVEGMEVNHIHVKLYPVFRVYKKTETSPPEEKLLEKWYSGFITTLHGPRAKEKKLAQYARLIKSTIEAD
jgi:diadenosine tetraphosphate (Ap4A) HIT family hydrolase